MKKSVRPPVARRARHDYSRDDVVIAMTIVARVVQLHGRAYIPHFERMEAECDDRRRLASALRRADRVAETVRVVGVAGFIEHWGAAGASEGL